VERLARRPLLGRPSLRWLDRREKSLLSDHKIILYSHDERSLKIVYIADSRQDLDAIHIPNE
jgi:plasmid stabilization system protein ParE